LILQKSATEKDYDGEAILRMKTAIRVDKASEKVRKDKILTGLGIVDECPHENELINFGQLIGTSYVLERAKEMLK
jgi:hypothetical protein